MAHDIERCTATTREECLSQLGFNVSEGGELVCPAHGNASCSLTLDEYETCESMAAIANHHPPKCQVATRHGGPLDYTWTECDQPAIGRVIGTGGESGPVACWACAIVSVGYEGGLRGWLPLDLVSRFRFSDSDDDAAHEAEQARLAAVRRATAYGLQS